MEGVDHQRHALLPVGDVNLRPADVAADGESDSHALNVVRDQAIAGGVMLLVARGTHALVVSVHHLVPDGLGRPSVGLPKDPPPAGRLPNPC